MTLYNTNPRKTMIIAFLIGILSFTAGVTFTYSFGLFYPVEHNCQQQLSCPEPQPRFEGEINNYINSQELQEELDIRDNNIQATNNDIQPELQGSTLQIEEIDSMSKVSGKSMQPRFFTGHTVLYRKIEEPDTLQEGDVIRYYTDRDNYAVHTIEGLYLYKNEVRTRGDNNREGETIHTSNITHKAVGVIFT